MKTSRLENFLQNFFLSSCSRFCHPSINLVPMCGNSFHHHKSKPASIIDEKPKVSTWFPRLARFSEKEIPQISWEFSSFSNLHFHKSIVHTLPDFNRFVVDELRARPATQQSEISYRSSLKWKRFSQPFFPGSFKNSNGHRKIFQT